MSTDTKQQNWMELGASGTLEEGAAIRFELPCPPGLPIPCFVVRKGGAVYAYVNRCMHWPVTLDMETGDFWDYEGDYLQCRTHGALYQLTGDCVAGPCAGERLTVLPVVETEGRLRLDLSALPPLDDI
jgi:nitrite reductase/ring-hydroxylating ferredoxin subunit